MKRIHLINIYSIVAALLWTTAMTSCFNEDGEQGDSEPGYATVSIVISANGMGDLNATRDADYVSTEEGSSGEYIRSLCVFIVDASGTIEKKITPDLTNNADAKEGNLKSYTIEDITLSTGAKTIYAFANLETISSEVSSITELEEGDGLEGSLLKIAVSDPAGKINIANGKYIPMSAIATATVNADLNYKILPVSVTLNRLVGKVRIYAVKNTEDITVSSLSFSGTATTVPLFDDANYSPGDDYTYEYTGKYENNSVNTTVTETTQPGTLLAEFYVNETTGSNSGFGILISTATGTGTTYSATTVRTDIKRNYIYPLYISFEENTVTPIFAFSLSPKTAGIGTSQTSYVNMTQTEGESNGLTITLLDVTTSLTIGVSVSGYTDDELEKIEWTASTPASPLLYEVGNTTDGYTYTTTAQTATGSSISLTITGFTTVGTYEYKISDEDDYTFSLTAKKGDGTEIQTYEITLQLTDTAPVLPAPVSPWNSDAGCELLQLRPATEISNQSQSGTLQKNII